jgi:O-antigen/teichoic acid export membrane protein
MEQAAKLDQVQRGLTGGAEAGDFKARSVRGGAAAVASQAFGLAMQILTTVVLARILKPEDYGLQGMLLAFTAFVNLFKDAGLNAAVVQRKTLTHEELSSLFWINVTLGTVLTVVVAAMAPVLAAFYREPRLVGITVLSSTIFFLNSLIVQHNALLDRAMRFTTGALIAIGATLLSTTVVIVLAALGFGYWSLIIQNVSIPIFTGIAVYIAMPWRPGRPGHIGELRSMLRFGGTITLNSFVVYIAYNMEKILLGRYWGATQLGIYGRAYQLANLPVQQLINTVHGVAFAALSRIQDDAERLQRAFLKSLSLIASVTIPVVIGSALFADEAVAVVLGPKWTGVSPVLRWLSPTILVFALVNPFSWFLRATGRVQRSLNIAFLICPVVILGVVAGLRYGPTGVAAGYSAAMVVLLVPVVAWTIHGTGITAAHYLQAALRPLGAGALAGVLAWWLRSFLLARLGPIPVLAIGLTVPFAFYVWLLVFVIGPTDMYTDLLQQLFHRKRTVVAPA